MYAALLHELAVHIEAHGYRQLDRANKGPGQIQYDKNQQRGSRGIEHAVEDAPYLFEQAPPCLVVDSPDYLAHRGVRRRLRCLLAVEQAEHRKAELISQRL